MSLLFTRKPIVINAELADRIGLNEAIVLQQINYWITGSMAGEEYDGRKWVYNTFEKWQEENFPFWSVDTVKRTLTKLKKLGLVEVKQLRKSQHDHTNFYTINFENALLSDQGKLHQSNGAKCNSPSGQNAPAHDGNLPQSDRANCPNLHTETTTEITAENTADTSPGAGNPAPAAAGLPAVLSDQKQEEQSGHKEPTFEKIRAVFWEWFDTAYQAKYGTVLPRNAKTNAQVKKLIQRLGKEAPGVARFYVTNVTEPRVVMASHTLDFLLLNAEGYRTQWMNGRAMTQGRARQIDSTQTNMNVADEALAMLRAKNAREAGNDGA